MTFGLGGNDPTPAICDINAALAKALAVRGAKLDKDWLIAQLGGIVAGMVLPKGVPVSMAYLGAHNQAESLLEGLENGTLKPGPALYEQLKTLTENIESALDCVPPPINISDQKPGPAVQPVPAPISAPAVPPPPPPPLVPVAGPVAVGGRKDNPNNANAPFDAYTPLLPGVCQSVEQAIDMINKAQWTTLSKYVYNSVTVPLMLAYNDAVSKGNTQLAGQLLDLLNILEKFPSGGQIWVAALSYFGWKTLAAKMLTQLHAIAKVTCAEEQPLKFDDIPEIVGQKTPVGVVVVGVVALAGVCIVGGLVGLPALGINLLGGGTPEATDSQSGGGMACNLRCDSEIGGCAEGLSCALLEYQGSGLPPRTVCWNTTTCSDGQHEAGSCWAPCDGGQSGSQCDAGLTCTLMGNSLKGSFVCFNSATCPPEGTDEATTATESSSGQPVLPQSDCACTGTDYICTNADGTIASASFNSTQCGGSGQCECREPDKALACPDGTYAPFNPACGVGGTDCKCQYVAPDWIDSCTGLICVP